MAKENVERSDWKKLIEAGFTENKTFFGTVAYFERQIGFIEPDNCMTDMFFRYDQIEPDKKEGYKKCRSKHSDRKGDRVSFQVKLREGNPVGINIQILRTKDEEIKAVEAAGINFNSEAFNK